MCNPVGFCEIEIWRIQLAFFLLLFILFLYTFNYYTWSMNDSFPESIFFLHIVLFKEIFYSWIRRYTLFIIFTHLWPENHRVLTNILVKIEFSCGYCWHYKILSNNRIWSNKTLWSNVHNRITKFQFTSGHLQNNGFIYYFPVEGLAVT